jgi:hypothetical protein
VRGFVNALIKYHAAVGVHFVKQSSSVAIKNRRTYKTSSAPPVARKIAILVGAWKSTSGKKLRSVRSLPVCRKPSMGNTHIVAFVVHDNWK